MAAARRLNIRTRRVRLQREAVLGAKEDGRHGVSVGQVEHLCYCEEDDVDGGLAAEARQLFDRVKDHGEEPVEEEDSERHEGPEDHPRVVGDGDIVELDARGIDFKADAVDRRKERPARRVHRPYWPFPDPAGLPHERKQLHRLEKDDNILHNVQRNRSPALHVRAGPLLAGIRGLAASRRLRVRVRGLPRAASGSRAGNLSELDRICLTIAGEQTFTLLRLGPRERPELQRRRGRH